MLILANKSEVQRIIPQKPPMTMVDILITNDDKTSVSQFAIDEQNIFCKNGVFHEPGLIENIAQTAALRNGYEAKQLGEEAGKGFIGSVKRLTIFKLPTDTDTLTTKITVLHELMNAMVIKGKVFVNTQLMAECEMNIFLLNNSNTSKGL